MNTDKKLLAILVPLLLLIASAAVSAQSKPPKVAETPAVVSQFLKATGPEPEGDAMLAQAKEVLWSVYLNDQSLKQQLVAYIQSAPDGPGLAFAGIALIPFHDPATVKPLIDRAIDRRTSLTTRWYFLSAAPYILAMGDVFYEGEGKLDGETRDFAREILEVSEHAIKRGLGRFHATALREVFDKGKKDPDYGLALWHLSAYLVGTLDARDRDVLAPIFTPDSGNAFANLLMALSLGANRNFLADLQAAEPSKVTREMEDRTAKQALTWWKEYLSKNSSGDWLPAIISGFREAGYELEDDLKSDKSVREVLRAMNDKSEVTQYNSYRLLNEVFNTHFDLERIFNSGKYALSFLEPMSETTGAKARLKKYWQERLKR